MADQFPPRIGKYEVRSILGEGGFGRVFKAFDPTVGRPVALKVLTAQSSPDMLARFQNEATAAGNLHHENIVTIYEFGVWDNAPYIAMEFLEGADLNQIMNSGQPVSLLDKVRIMTQVGQGLKCAHEYGVVHRDVKPANIKVLPNKSVKMMDFGIARLTRDEGTRLTQKGDLVGTIRYMSPEQFSALDVDSLCDIFAYGVIFYEFVSGVHPFEAPDVASFMYRITGAQPVPLSNLVPSCPPALHQIVMRAIEKDRDLRYQSLDDLLLDTRPVLLELQKERASELLRQAQGLFSSGQAPKAQTLLKEILDLDPNNPEGWELRERIQQSMHRQSIRPKVEGFLKSAENDVQRRQYALAIEALEAAQKLDPNATSIQQRISEVRQIWEGSVRANRLLADATREMQRENLPLAERLASEALHHDPANERASEFVETLRVDLRRRDREQRLKLAIDDARRLAAVEDFEAALHRLDGLAPEDDTGGQAAALRENIQRQKVDREREERLRSEKQVLRGLLKESRLADALPRLESLCAEFPDDRDLLALLADTGQQIYVQRRADDLRAAREEVASLQAAGHFAEAEEVLHRLAAAYTNDSEIRFLLEAATHLREDAERRHRLELAVREAQRLRGDRRYDDARALLDAAQRDFGDDAALIDERKQLDNEWNQHRKAERARQAVSAARAKVAEGAFDSALLYLKQASTDDPQNPEIDAVMRDARGQAEMQRANRFIDQACAQAREMAGARDFEAAAGVLKTALETHPADPRLEGLLDAINGQKQEWEVEQRLREAVRVCSQLIRDRRYPEAIHALEAHLKVTPNEAALLKLLAQAKKESLSARKADGLARALAEIQAAFGQGRLDEAAVLLEHHSKEFGAEPGFQAVRAQMEEGARQVERKRRVDEAESQVRNLLNQGNRAAALQVCQTAMQRDPDAPQLLELFSSLQQQVVRDRRESEVARLGGLARQAIALNDWNTAGARIDELRRQYPDEPSLRALDDALKQERRKHDSEAAVAALEDALQRSDWPRAEKQLTALQSLASDSPRIAEARARIESGKRRARTVTDARAALKKERFEEAERLLAPIVADRPGDAEASDLLKQAQTARAAVDADLAIRQGRKQARALAKDRNYDQAIGILKGLIGSYGTRPEVEQDLSQISLEAEVHRTVMHLQERRTAGDAKTVYEGATQILSAGDSPEARELLSWSRIAMAKEKPAPPPPQKSAVAPTPAPVVIPDEPAVAPWYKRPAIAAGLGVAVLAAAGVLVKVLFLSGPPPVPLAVTSSAPAQATVGQPYSGAVSASGGTAPYRWTVARGNLPPGLLLDPATGAISGLPVGDGSFDFGVRATDQASHTADTSVTVVIRPKVVPLAPPGTPLSLDPATLPDATVGVDYTFQMQAIGGKPPYSWTIAKPPAGITLDGGGTLRGKPVAAGTFSLPVRVKDSAAGSATQTFSLTVAKAPVVQPPPPPPPNGQPPKITTSSLRTGTAGQAYRDLLVGEGGKAPYTWSVSGDTLPSGLRLNSSTGDIAGTPSAAARANLTLHLSDAEGHTAPAVTLALQISPGQPDKPPPPTALCPPRTSTLKQGLYTGDPSGTIVWSGRPGEPVSIQFDQVSRGGGSLASRTVPLTGAPVDITRINPPDTKILEAPSRQNGWACIAFQPAAGSVTIDWVVNWGR